MRRMIVVCVICFSAAMLLAQTEENPRTSERPKVATQALLPLNVKTGLWQMTETVTWTGLPPQMAAVMKQAAPTHYKSCVKTKDLSSNPWADGSSEKCTWTALNSTGTDMDVQATGCELGKNYGMTANVHGKIHVVDSENGTGSMAVTLTGNGQTINGNALYTGKWIGPSCPADMN